MTVQVNEKEKEKNNLPRSFPFQKEFLFSSLLIVNKKVYKSIIDIWGNL
jgi:hypothetical protein